jgi:type I site-specific restriction-modification system R (restriction) subunit
VGIVYALKYICTLKEKNPIYKSIAEKVKELIKKWEENVINIEGLRIEVENLLNYIESKEKEKEKTELREQEFGIKLILENYEKINKSEVENIAKELYKSIEPLLFPEWNKNSLRVREVLGEIRRYLSKLKPKYDLSRDELDQLHKEIFELISNYG